MPRTLYARLSLSVLVLVGLLGSLLILITQQTSELYSDEVTQRLNASVAMYVTDEQQLIEAGEVNQSALELLGNRAMTINPTVEIYVLDETGRILSHVLPEGSVVREQVSLEPVSRFLAGGALPIAGDDPRHPDVSKVFSASPITDDGKTVGYLYAVLGGEKYESIREAVSDSYVLTTSLTAMVGSIATAVIVAMAVFFVLTRRLAKLRSRLDAFDYDDPASFEATALSVEHKRGADEVDELTAAFEAMASRIGRQYQALRHMDDTRRELIANVSHDLRTPLASLQGYIETLLIKEDEFTPEAKREYLKIAYRHSQRLNKLIAELFELAKLDAGAVHLKSESFSLTELVYDCVQTYELQASEKNIDLRVEAPSDNLFVKADIALIERVLQNLVDNALKHTPSGESITVSLKDSETNAVIAVADTGEGIATHEIPHIFERFYQSMQREDASRGSGLGLAIVKKILDLHQSTIRVRSEVNQGTAFEFDLPLQAA